MKFILISTLLAATCALKITHCTFTDGSCTKGKACSETDVDFDTCASVNNVGTKSFKNSAGELCTASFNGADCKGTKIAGTEDCYKDGGCYTTESGSVSFKSDAAIVGGIAAILVTLVSTRI